MSEPPAAPITTYTARLSIKRLETTYALNQAAIVWSGGRVDLDQIRSMRLYTVPGLTMIGAGAVSPFTRRCVIRSTHGRALVLSSQHVLGVGQFENRAATYRPFVQKLARRVATVNPKARLLGGMPRAVWWFWFASFGSMTLLGSVVVVAVVGVLARQGLSWSGGGLLMVSIGITVSMLAFLPGVWRRRSHTLCESDYD